MPATKPATPSLFKTNVRLERLALSQLQFAFARFNTLNGTTLSFARSPRTGELVLMNNKLAYNAMKYRFKSYRDARDRLLPLLKANTLCQN